MERRRFVQVIEPKVAMVLALGVAANALVQEAIAHPKLVTPLLISASYFLAYKVMGRLRNNIHRREVKNNV